MAVRGALEKEVSGVCEVEVDCAQEIEVDGGQGDGLPLQLACPVLSWMLRHYLLGRQKRIRHTET